MSKAYKMLQIPVTKDEYDKIMSLAKKENRSIPSQIKVTLKNLFAQTKPSTNYR